jgi:hypothetical protein
MELAISSPPSPQNITAELHTQLLNLFRTKRYSNTVLPTPRCTKHRSLSFPRFRSPRFCISLISFQYHEARQYPIRRHGRSCYACPLSCARSFTDSPSILTPGTTNYVLYACPLSCARSFTDSPSIMTPGTTNYVLLWHVVLGDCRHVFDAHLAIYNDSGLISFHKDFKPELLIQFLCTWE